MINKKIFKLIIFAVLALILYVVYLDYTGEKPPAALEDFMDEVNVNKIKKKAKNIEKDMGKTLKKAEKDMEKKLKKVKKEMEKKIFRSIQNSFVRSYSFLYQLPSHYNCQSLEFFFRTYCKIF